MKWICIIALLMPAMIAAGEAAPAVFQSDPSVLVNAKRRWLAGDVAAVAAVKRIESEARRVISDGPYSVVQKNEPGPSRDPHDYVSLAPYWWPNPEKPDGLPYIRKDGKRNPGARGFDADRMGAMSSRAYTLALAYYFTADEQFAERAALLLRVWFIDAATRMNPHLNHAQIVRGRDEGRGFGIIDSVRLLDAIDAIGLIAGSKSWTADDQRQIKAWFAEYVKWMRESRNGRDEAATFNNHGTWYDVQLVTFMLFLGEVEAARSVLEEAKTSRIAVQIEPDGRQPRELARTKSFGYCVFNLRAMTHLADLGNRAGVDLWNHRTDDGRSISGAIDWMMPYISREQQWDHEELEEINPGSMYVVLSRAAKALRSKRYAQEALRPRSGGDRDREALLHPIVE